MTDVGRGVQEAAPRVVRFGVFELDRRCGELRRSGMRVRLQEQPLRVLDALLAEPGEPVTRDALRQRLWPDDTFVDFDNGLNRAINRLRAALGDRAQNPRFIETLERRGYRFVAPVGVAAPPTTPAAPGPMSGTVLAAGQGPGRPSRLRRALAAVALVGLLFLPLVPSLWRRASSDGLPIRSLAVLPLANLTGDPAQDYFSDGMTDALITNLASLSGLRVISRQSVMRYKGSAKPLPEIARELGVETVVEGSVLKSGGRVRVTAQLVHAPGDRHLWAQSYERRLEDVLALQGELARVIAREVHLTLSPAETRQLTPERGVDPGAYDAYLLGRHHWNQRTEESLSKAIEYFRSAIAKDPDFAPAHAGLAQAYGPRLARGYVPPGRGLSEMKAAALRALELDPGLGEARAALASSRVLAWDWPGADAEFRAAVEAAPNSALVYLWYGWYLRGRGRHDEALAHHQRALVLDPLNLVVNRAVASSLAITGQDEAALAQWKRTLELGPDHTPTQVELGLYQLQHGHAAEGMAHLERARFLGPDDPWNLATLAFGYAATANTRQARRLLGELEAASTRRYVSSVLPAFVHAALGQRDRAFALIDEAYAAKDPLLIHIEVDERASGLRPDPRFDELVRRMGLIPRAAEPTAGS